LPWVVAKYAMTLDGKIATREGDSKWISGEESRQVVHELRNELDAILVGTGTLAADDPRLSARIEGGRDPIRVLMDAEIEYAPRARAVTQNDEGVKVLVFVSESADRSRVDELARIDHIEVVQRPVDDRGFFDVEDVLRTLADPFELTSVLVEGGGGVLGSLFDAGAIDRVYAFVAPRLVGGTQAPGPIQGEGFARMKEAVGLESVEVREYGSDILITGDVRQN